MLHPYPPPTQYFFIDPVITQIRQELKDHQDMEIRKTSQRFFKDEITCYGIKTATVMAIAKKYWKVVQAKTQLEIFFLCEELYKSGYLEESFIVSNWTNSLVGQYEREDLPVFRNWIDSYITNWASCDGFCNHTIGSFIEQYPEDIKELKMLDKVAEPLDAPCGCSITHYTCKTREIPKRVFGYCGPSAH